MISSRKVPKTDIRGKILRFLKYRGRTGIMEVAKHLRVSHEGARRQLTLMERNCPYLNVAMEHPALCSLSVFTLERLLGHPVIREELFQSDHGRCVFRVRLGRALPRGKFRFESEEPSADV